jgi:hypothetical protein
MRGEFAMPSLHAFKGKALSIAAVGAIAAMLIPAGSRAQDAKALDLPAALISPADAASAGFSEYGLVMGWTANSEDLIYVMVQSGDASEDDARTQVEESGLGTIYSQSLHPILNPPEDGPLHGIAIQSSITSFPDADQAEAGLEYMRLNSDAEHVADAPEIGDYADMTEYDLPAGEVSELPLNAVDVVMRFDHVVATLSLLGYDADVEQADAVALAEVFGDKIDALINGEKIGTVYAPELSLMVPAYFDEGACVCRMQYTVVGGEAVPLSYLRDAQLDLQARADEYGMTSQFYQLVRFAGDGGSGGTDPSMYVRISKFAQADDAARYVEEAPDWVEGGYLNTETPYTNVEEVDEADQVAAGDSAVTLFYENVSFNGDALHGLIAVIQDGRYVYEISIDGFTAPDTELAQTMVDQLIVCADGSCTEVTEIPAELMTYFSGPGDQE